MRFARNVHFQIKNGKEQEFSTLFEKEVLPLLQRQEGFQEEVTLVNKAGAMGISLWNDRKSAETYESATYPKVLAKLTSVIEGTPKVETYETVATFARA